MGKRILVTVAVASLLTVAATGCRGLADDAARSADDVIRGGGKIVKNKPALLPEPATAHPAPAPEPIEAPPAVKGWTDDLSEGDANEVNQVACILKDLPGFVFAESNDERRRIASEYVVEEDKLEVAVGLAGKLLEGEDIDPVEEYCDLFG